MTPFVAVPAGELVAVGDLALLGHVDADQLVDAGGQFVVVLAGEHPDADDLAWTRRAGTFSEVSRTRGPSPKMARSRRSSGVSSVSPFGVTLPTRDVAVADLGADADDAARSSRSASTSSETFGMSW